MTAESRDQPTSLKPHPACQADDDLLAACDMRFTRRSGPGGQHRNKVETAVVLLHRPTEITAEAHEERSQAENRRTALFRLRLKLAVNLRSEPPSDIAPTPSDLWTQRRHGSRIAVASEHRDFPSLIAEALDTLSFHGYAPTPTAEHLRVSASQLIGLLRQHGPALAALNQQRAAQGKPPLK